MVIMTVGLPKSGKTTYANELEKYGFEYFTSTIDKDAIISAIEMGQNIVIDSYNLSRIQRMAFIQYLDETLEQHVEKKCVLFVKPFALLRTRIKQSHKFKISNFDANEELMKYATKFNPPSYMEGWDDIEIVWSTMTGNVLDPETLKFSDKDDYYRLGQHMENARLYYETSTPIKQQDKLLATAIYYHDLGRVNYYYLETDDDNAETLLPEENSENLSAYLYLVLENDELIENCLFEQKNYSTGACVQFILTIANMINFQKKPENEWKICNLEVPRKRYGSAFVKQIYKLNECDRLTK